MPIMPSTTYHKYDTMDYKNIDSQYGSLEDFEKLIEECHSRGIRVIIDLAMNHSSSKHQWFLTAADYLKKLPEGAEPDSEECPYVDYYHFSKEQESGYAPVAGTEWYYEARFWSEMPDLNLKNEALRREFEQIADFWLEKGVDGFRLDAVKEYVTGSVADNVEILSWFNEYVKTKNPQAYLVGECWTDGNTYVQYYASGLDSMFAFDFADKSGIIANVMNGKSPATAYVNAQLHEKEMCEVYNSNYISAPFYTNHDMGRSAGYYAGENSPAQTKMGNALNLLMSGNVFLYYGEELGMKGAGKDENKRAPMYWSKNENAQGMCDGPADMENVKMKFDSLEEQSGAPDSIYNYVKRAIRLRNQNPEIARGTVKFYSEFSSEKCFVLTKYYEGNEILIVGNTTAETAEVALDGLIVMDKEVSGLKVLGELLADEGAAQYHDNTVTMPPFSIIVMGAE